MDMPDHGWGYSLLGIVEVMHRQTNLFEVIGTLHSPSGFAGCLYGGKQKGDQHSDDGDDDEEFDEGETC